WGATTGEWGVRADVYDEVMLLIHDLRLHDGPGPVDLTPLENIFVPHRLDLELVGASGLTMQRSRHYKPSILWPVGIAVDINQSAEKQREIYSHEIGHVLCGHEGSLRSLDVDDWFHDRAEFEATEVASLLLIPLDDWLTGDPIDVVARRCR